MGSKTVCEAIAASWAGTRAATDDSMHIQLWTYVETQLVGMWKLALHAHADQETLDDIELLQHIAHHHWVNGRL